MEEARYDSSEYKEVKTQLLQYLFFEYLQFTRSFFFLPQTPELLRQQRATTIVTSNRLLQTTVRSDPLAKIPLHQPRIEVGSAPKSAHSSGTRNSRADWIGQAPPNEDKERRRERKKRKGEGQSQWAGPYSQGRAVGAWWQMSERVRSPRKPGRSPSALNLPHIRKAKKKAGFALSPSLLPLSLERKAPSTGEGNVGKAAPISSDLLKFSRFSLFSTAYSSGGFRVAHGCQRLPKMVVSRGGSQPVQLG